MRWDWSRGRKDGLILHAAPSTRQKLTLPFILTTLELYKKGGTQKYTNGSVFFFFLTLSYLRSFPSLGDRAVMCHQEDGDCRRKHSQASVRPLGQAAQRRLGSVQAASLSPCLSGPYTRIVG